MNPLIFFLLLVSVNSNPESVSTNPDSTKSSPDSTKLNSDSTKLNYPKKDPTVALLLSTLPGGGQFYTGNYIKGVVFGAAQAYFGGGTIYLHFKAEEAKKEGSINYDWYSERRYDFFWWDALVWGLSMVDAYVSAHFYKFKEQGSIKLDTSYKIQDEKFCLSFYVTF